MSFKDQVQKLAYKVGGAAKTIHDREVVVKRLASQLQCSNIQIKDIKFLKSKHIEIYIQSRLTDDGIGKRTALNEMACIRAVLREAGHNKLADSDRLSNSSLDIGGASREGTKTAMPNEMFRERLSFIDNINSGVGSCMMLERLLGLRGEEAVQSVKSLETWVKDLEHGDKIRVIYGTKGGRPRDTHVVHVGRAKEAILLAIERTKKNGGWLIDRPDLKTAMNHYSYILRSNGFTGQYSPHCMRYAYARDRYNTYLKQGFTVHESLAMTSMDLGHGDGRGAYVKKVYLK
ncbi:MAG TPA: integrase domain-containing protein [Methylotenera sp.]